MSEQLKPCPFCGPGNSVVDYYQDPYGYHIVGCGRCGSHSGTRPQSDPDGKARVIASWNSRPMEDLPRTVQAAPSDREKRMETALYEAASSLETISANAGRYEYMEDMLQVRGYANSRATVARAALADTTTGEVQP